MILMIFNVSFKIIRFLSLLFLPILLHCYVEGTIRFVLEHIFSYSVDIVFHCSYILYIYHFSVVFLLIFSPSYLFLMFFCCFSPLMLLRLISSEICFLFSHSILAVLKQGSTHLAKRYSQDFQDGTLERLKVRHAVTDNTLNATLCLTISILKRLT